MEETKVAQKGDLLSFRPDIKVLDATIRDGGLVNDFYFTDEFIRNLYLANVKGRQSCRPCKSSNICKYYAGSTRYDRGCSQKGI